MFIAQIPVRDLSPLWPQSQIIALLLCQRGLGGLEQPCLHAGSKEQGAGSTEGREQGAGSKGVPQVPLVPWYANSKYTLFNIPSQQLIKL